MEQESKLPRKNLPRRTIQRKAGPTRRSDVKQSSSAFSHINEIGKEPGVEIWKMIDEDTLEKVPRANHGSFSVDRVYLVLFTTYGEESLSYHIHSWFGDVVKDEPTLIQAAEDRVNELEAILEGKPVVTHKEVQNHEAADFMSYFKSGLTYIPPVKLQKVDFEAIQQEKERVKLYHLQGRRNIRAKQVEPTAKNLNKGDVFILDANDIIYQWNGSKASRMKKGRALDLTVRMRDERAAKAVVVVLEEFGEDDDKFWDFLGGKEEIGEPIADEAELEKQAFSEMKLLRVTESEDGKGVELERLNEGGVILDTKMLASNHCFILDCVTELYVWIGKASPQKLKTESMTVARSLLQEDGRPSWTPITKCSQGAETAMLKDKFKKGDWGEYIESYNKVVKGKIAKTERQETINIDELHNPEKYKIAKEEFNEIIPSASDDVQGTLEIWFVEKNDKKELPESEYGVFYSAECYLIQYSIVRADRSRRYVVYFWQGGHSSTDDKGTSALLAKDIGASLGGACIQARVVQGKEPEHFLSHFKGKMLVKRGKRLDAVDPSVSRLFHVRGNSAVNTRAIEMAPESSNLNSNDVFIVVTEKESTIWKGKFSTEQELKYAQSISVLLGAKFTTISEGEESEGFWEALGGKQEYSNESTIKKQFLSKARLFQGTSATGVFKVFEVKNFSQDDLDDEDVMILDAISEVYVWIGSGSSDEEKKRCMQTAIEYIKQAPEGRQDTPIYVVHAGFEPPAFTMCFHGWDDKKAKHTADAYVRKLHQTRKRIGPGFRENSGLLELFFPEGFLPKKAKPTKKTHGKAGQKVSLKKRSASTTTAPDDVSPKPAVGKSSLGLQSSNDKPEDANSSTSSLASSTSSSTSSLPSSGVSATASDNESKSEETSTPAPSSAPLAEEKTETPNGEEQGNSNGSSSNLVSQGSESAGVSEKKGFFKNLVDRRKTSGGAVATLAAVASARDSVSSKEKEKDKTPTKIATRKVETKTDTPTVKVDDEDKESSLRSPVQYPFDRIKKKPLPEDVDPEHLERHVSDQEFYQFLKMTRVKFEALPKWKQLNIKKQVGLF